MSLFIAAASSLAERIRVNSITRETRGGRLFFVKRRRRSARLTLAVANRFFLLAQNPVQALADLGAWQRWEIDCFHLLHGPGHRAAPVDARTVAAEALPGCSLAEALERHSLTPEMTAAAGRELRRCHDLACTRYRAGWSHGDPHAGNFLFDPADGRARLIDFEVIHDPSLPAPQRHADDLLVFLQDLIGRVTRAEWLPLARAFLEAYGCPATITRLVPRLSLPRGIPRLWWAVRTSYLPAAELHHRLEALRAALLRAGAAG